MPTSTRGSIAVLRRPTRLTAFDHDPGGLTMAATTEQIRETIDNYIARMTASDREGWLALFTEDATVEDPVGSEVKNGHAGIGEFWDFVHSLSPSIELRLNGPMCIAAP